MIINAFGLPSGFTQWAVHLLRVFTDFTLRDVDYLTAGDLNQMRTAWATRKHANLFFYADCPDRPLVNLFLKVNSIPSIILVEDPADITGYIMRERELEWPWAVRLTNQCVAALSDLFLEQNTLMLKREYELTFEEFFNAVAHHCNIPLSVGQIDEMMRIVDPSGVFSRSTALEDAMTQRLKHVRPVGYVDPKLTQEELAVMEGIHIPMRDLIACREVSTVALDRQMLISGDRPQSVLYGVIEMLGPARCLCFGPYVHLPCGDWHAVLEFTISENLSGNTFDIDVYHRDVISVESFELPAMGRFAAHVPFRVVDPRDAVQIRLIMREGAIEGVLDVKSITFSSVSDPRTQRLS